MNFTEIFIKRPAFTIVLSLIITIIGIISFRDLQVRWVPNIMPPVVSISTEYPGASANLVETQITTPIENGLAGVDGVETLFSNSRQGRSYISLTFKLGHNINAAVEDIRGALQNVVGQLPKDVKTPYVNKMDINSSPILYIAFSDPKRSTEEINHYLKQFITPSLQSIDGVANVYTYGERVYAMHLWLDPMKMAAANVTVDDVNKTLTEQNVQIPSGQIRSKDRFYSIVTDATLKSVNEFNDLIIRSDQGHVVRLKDIGQAVVDSENSDSVFRSNGQQAIALAIVPQSTANPLSVADQVEKEVVQVQKTLPEGMQGKIIFNEASFIHSSIHHVYQSLFEAVAFVLIVILLFLASWRAAIIPIITIPICLIATFTILLCCGFSINTITLMAFVLAIGLVVDDAIVMLENITRYIESGISPMLAAVKGSKEMIFPIIAMTLTLAAVYTPIAFTSGLLGTVFREFAMTLAGTVLISGFIALTLSPMMCSRLLNRREKQNQYAELINQKLTHWQNQYAKLLNIIFDKKKWVIILLIIFTLIGALAYYFLPSELAPTEDMDEVDIGLNAPHDASFSFTDNYARQLEAIYQKMSGVDSIGSAVGFGSPANGFQFLMLKPHSKRKESAVEMAAQLNVQLMSMPGINASVFTPTSPLTWFSDGNGSSVDMNIQSATDYKTLHQMTQRMVAAAQKSKVFSHVDSQLKWDGDQFELHIDKEKAAVMQVPLQNITNTISTFLAGHNAGNFEYDGNQYDIVVQMNQAALANPNIISQLYVRNANNKMVPISDLVSMTEVSSPDSLPHFDRLRNDVLFASLAPGYTIGDAVSVLQKIAKQTLPDSAKYSFQGQAKDYLDSNGKVIFTFLLALIFIYLVLVAQFESFIDPFIILLTVPFAVVGAFITLKLMGCSLNIYSNIGLVTLIGLIAKHGILITDFANKKRAMGFAIQAAVIEAAKLRLRPILMTTAAMVLGALPLALASGSGAESRQPVGWVIVGGLLFGTFFSLIVIPVAYTYLARFRKIEVTEEYWLTVSEKHNEREKVAEC